MSMQLVQQPPLTDCCGAACVATLCHLTLETACRIVGETRAGSRRIIATLRRFGFRAEFKCRQEEQDWSARALSSGHVTALILLRGKDKRTGHWSVWEKGVFFDPQKGRVRALVGWKVERFWPLHREKFASVNPDGTVALARTVSELPTSSAS